MTWIALILLTTSSIMHAGWNYIGKKQTPTVSFFLLASACGCFFLSPVFLVFPSSLNWLTAEITLWILVSGVFQSIYLGAMAAAYRNGQLSIAYPIIRALPVLLVTLIVSLFALGKAISAIDWLGIGLVLVGTMLLPGLRHWRQTKSMGLGLACISALGTTGYSLIDKHALTLISHFSELPQMVNAIYFAFFQGMSASIWLGLFVMLKGNLNQMTAIWISKKAGILGTGVFMTGCYTMVLASMYFVDNLSYVVAMRQLSIPLAMLLGIVLLKEPATWSKLSGGASVLSGLLLLAWQTR